MFCNQITAQASWLNHVCLPGTGSDVTRTCALGANLLLPTSAAVPGCDLHRGARPEASHQGECRGGTTCGTCHHHTERDQRDAADNVVSNSTLIKMYPGVGDKVPAIFSF